MTKREIRRRGWAHLTSGEAVDAALELLEDCGWLQVDLIKPAVGRPSEVIRLHPELTTGL